jgi:hypothetical protein
MQTGVQGCHMRGWPIRRAKDAEIQMDLGSFGGCAELAARHDGGMASAEVQWLAMTGLRGQGPGARGLTMIISLCLLS